MGTALLGAVLGAACGGDDAPTRAGRGGRGGGPGGPDREVPVETAVVERGSIAREIELSGVVEPIRWVVVNSQLSTTVASLHAEEGDRVAEGTVLARLDAGEVAPLLESAEAAYEVAKAAFERAETLRERQVITLPEYERDRAALAAAEAQLRQLRTRTGYATVRSPLTGVVIEKNVEAGDVVAPQQQLFRVADVSTLVVRVGVSELDVAGLAQGNAVDVTLDAAPDSPLRGAIRRIFPAADPSTRLVPVEIALERGSLARPGFLARVELRLGERKDVPVVPASAIVTGGGGEAAFIVVDGKAVRREVETGLVSEGRIEIVSGLAPGETVVVVGNHNLRDGARVRPAGAAPAGERPAGQGGGS
jgi:membrane fusion protein (multidrug efflux system)